MQQSIRCDQNQEAGSIHARAAAAVQPGLNSSQADSSESIAAATSEPAGKHHAYKREGDRSSREVLT